MSATSRPAAPATDTLGLGDLNRRLAREMRIAASVADDCQDALGEDAQFHISPEMGMRLQGLDLLSQQLIELGKLLDRMASDGVQGHLPSSVLNDILLSDVKRRLGGQTDGVRVVDPELW